MIAECFLALGSTLVAIGAYRTFYQAQPSFDQVVRLPKLKVQPDSIPESMWWLNVRSAVSEKDWIKIKSKKKGSTHIKPSCEYCGSTDRLELHEQWEFLPDRVQRLNDLKLLCHFCHMVKHINYAWHKGEGPATLAHFMKVNEINKATAESYIKASSLEAKRLNSYSPITKSKQYKLDLTFLNQNRFGLVRIFTSDERESCKSNIRL